jgi:ZIP family zinc transporter
LALSVWVVFVVAFATALATGLGAVPLLLLRGRSDSWLGLGNAIAAGMMTAATIALLYEGGRDNVALTIAGVAVGAVFMIGARRVASHRHTLTFGSLRDADAVAALAIVGAMTIHSFTEGAGVGVSFGGGETLGFLIAIAIAVHNIPEGLAVSVVLVPRGTTVPRAAVWSVITSLPQPLVAVPAFLFVEEFGSLLPLGLGFAGGAMLWIAVTQLMPDALRLTSARSVMVAAAVSAGLMLALQAFLLAT